jgi:hypothetical protein
MADADAYKERRQELFSEHEEYEDLSLVFTFEIFFADFEFAGYEKMLAGEVSEEVLAMMGIESDVKMSEEGLATLRQAAAKEADECTADVRKKEKVMEKLCSELETSDSVTLGRLRHKAYGVRFDSALQRYKKLLASLSPGDRLALDAVFFDRKPGKLKHAPGRAVNGNHIRDTLATEFPDRVLEEAKRECERYELTKGKRCHADSRGDTLWSITESSGSRLVGE